MNRRTAARVLAALSVLALSVAVAGVAVGIVLAMSSWDQEPATVVLIAALVLNLVSFLLHAWGRRLIALPPFRGSIRDAWERC